MRILNRGRRPTVALDVGTATIRGCSADSEVIDAPSAVSEPRSSGAARGALRGGVVCDVSAAAEVIAPVLRRVGPRNRPPSAIVCAPTDATREERDLLIEAVVAAGASVSALIPEPLAAAIGAAIDVSSDYAQFVVDIGEGVTDLAVIRNGEIRRSAAQRSGCSGIRRSVVDWLRWHRSLVVGDAAADDLIRAFCVNGSRPDAFEVNGQGIGGDAAVCTVSRDDIGALVEPALDAISDFVREFFIRLPDRIAAEVIESGALLTGGGAVLDLLVQRIESSSGLTIVRAPSPLRSVIFGAREILRGGLLPTAA